MDDLFRSLNLGRYERSARLAPALFTLLPVLLLAAVWMPRFWGLLGGFTTLGLFCAAYLLMGLAREGGLAVQRRLETRLGGRPSTLALRHGGPRLNPNSRRKYHDALARLGVPIPTEADQAADPAGTDLSYASAVNRLLELTRGERFHMLLSENISYGFRRNLRGLKPTAIGVLLGCLLVDCAGLWLTMTVENEKIAAAAGLAAIYLGLILIWATTVTDAFVEAASWSYVDRLFACCEHLDPSNPIAEARP